jgi:hypothetical protein
MNKADVTYGYYQVWVQLEGIPKLGIALPDLTESGKPLPRNYHTLRRSPFSILYLRKRFQILRVD